MSNLRKTDESELQTRNGQDHQRVFAPETTRLLTELLEEIKKMNVQMSLITGEEL